MGHGATGGSDTPYRVRLDSASREETQALRERVTALEAKVGQIQSVLFAVGDVVEDMGMMSGALAEGLETLSDDEHGEAVAE